jgi:proline dehydrogenase
MACPSARRLLRADGGPTPTAAPRSLLYRLTTSTRFERAARAHPALERRCYGLARRYVAGRSLDDALAVVRKLGDQGLTASVDLFGEGLRDPEAVQPLVGRYREAAARLGELSRDAYLEVVPSHLGLDVSPRLLPNSWSGSSKPSRPGRGSK